MPIIFLKIVKKVIMTMKKINKTLVMIVVIKVK